MEKSTPAFKSLVLQLYFNGKPRREILEEYALPEAVLRRWVEDYQSKRQNTTPYDFHVMQLEIEKLKEENEKLRNENDILKQDVVIFES